MTKKTYEVTLWEKITWTVFVEASSKDKALDMAEEIVGMGDAVSESQGFTARLVEEVDK